MRLLSTVSEERRPQSFCQNQTLLCLSQKEIVKFHLLYELFLQKADCSAHRWSRCAYRIEPSN